MWTHKTLLHYMLWQGKSKSSPLKSMFISLTPWPVKFLPAVCGQAATTKPAHTQSFEVLQLPLFLMLYLLWLCQAGTKSLLIHKPCLQLWQEGNPQSWLSSLPPDQFAHRGIPPVPCSRAWAQTLPTGSCRWQLMKGLPQCEPWLQDRSTDLRVLQECSRKSVTEEWFVLGTAAAG